MPRNRPACVGCWLSRKRPASVRKTIWMASVPTWRPCCVREKPGTTARSCRQRTCWKNGTRRNSAACCWRTACAWWPGTSRWRPFWPLSGKRPGRKRNRAATSSSACWQSCGRKKTRWRKMSPLWACAWRPCSRTGPWPTCCSRKPASGRNCSARPAPGAASVWPTPCSTGRNWPSRRNASPVSSAVPRPSSGTSPRAPGRTWGPWWAIPACGSCRRRASPSARNS